MSKITLGTRHYFNSVEARKTRNITMLVIRGVVGEKYSTLKIPYIDQNKSIFKRN